MLTCVGRHLKYCIYNTKIPKDINIFVLFNITGNGTLCQQGFKPLRFNTKPQMLFLLFTFTEVSATLRADRATNKCESTRQIPPFQQTLYLSTASTTRKNQSRSDCMAICFLCHIPP